MKGIILLLLLLVTLAPLTALAANDSTPTIVLTSQISKSGQDQVTIPQISGIVDSEKQALINQQLRSAIFSQRNPEPESSLHGGFSVAFASARLLSIHFQGDSYTKPSAHPQKIDIGIHADLQTGKIYKLGDLFIKGADYTSILQALCRERKNSYRLQLPNLWDGWEHDTFERSWQGNDAAFLLFGDGVRLYSIPAYATGAISGYQVPYQDFIDYIDQSGPLWQAIQDKTPVQVKLAQ